MYSPRSRQSSTSSAKNSSRVIGSARRITISRPPGMLKTTGHNSSQQNREKRASCIFASNPSRNNRHSVMLGTFTAQRPIRRTFRVVPQQHITRRSSGQPTVGAFCVSLMVLYALLVATQFHRYATFSCSYSCFACL